LGYQVMGKCILRDSYWHDPLMCDPIELATTPIETFTADGTQTSDGTTHPADASSSPRAPL